MELRALRRELRRLYVQYLTALRTESRRHGLMSSTAGILLCRFVYGVGPRHYSLFGFSSLPRAQWSDYVTDDPAFKQYLLDMSPDTVRALVKNKALFYDHCISSGLPTIPTLGLLTAEKDTQCRHIPEIRNPEQWNRMLAGAPGDLFIKPLDGTLGEGVFRALRQGEQFRFLGRLGSARELYEHLQAGLRHECGWLVQRKVECHPGLGEIMSAQGLGTMRVVTRIDSQGRPQVLYSIMKIIVGDNAADNFHYGLSGNLVCAIDLHSGRLSAARGSESTDWPVISSYSHHPRTAHPIEGFEVPQWDDVLALALRAQESLPQLKSAGWDIALTPDGPVVVEGNSSYALDILQVAYGRGLRQELTSLLEATT